MEVILNTLLANRIALEGLIGAEITNILIEIYMSVVKILKSIKYPIGFDLYVSEDGVNFSSVFLNGLCNPNNYGGRILYVDCRNNLYIGTSNPFQGCEVWKATDLKKDFKPTPCDENHYKCLWEVNKILNDNFNIISKHMPVILKFCQKTNIIYLLINDKQ